MLVFACLNYSNFLRVPPPPLTFLVRINHGITNGGVTLLFEHGNKTRIVYLNKRFSFLVIYLFFFFIFPCIHRSWAPPFDKRSLIRADKELPLKMPVSFSIHGLSMVARWAIQISGQHQSFAVYPPTDVVEKFLFKKPFKTFWWR